MGLGCVLEGGGDWCGEGMSCFGTEDGHDIDCIDTAWPERGSLGKTQESSWRGTVELHTGVHLQDKGRCRSRCTHGNSMVGEVQTTTIHFKIHMYYYPSSA